MPSTVHDLATLLADRGVGTLNVDLFRGALPDQPDQALAVIEYAGEPPRLRPPGAPAIVERPRVQLVARGVSYKAAEDLARAAYEAVHAAAVDLNGTTYVLIEALQTPFLLREDDGGRTLVAFNIRTSRLQK